MDKLPLYNAVIDSEEDGIYCLSLVEYPATEINWVCFEKNQEQVQFKIEDEDKHIISTVVMTANTPIYRRNGDYEYYIQYKPETIAVMAEKMLADNAMNTYDIQHNDVILPKGTLSMVELYIVDREKGICPTFMDVPDGSLMCSLKVHDEELWQMAKDGTLKGLSLAGLFTVVEQEFNKDNKKNLKNMFNKIKEMIKDVLVTFASVKAEDGTELIYDGESIEVGTEVADTNGNPIADGDYKVGEKTYTVKDGKVESVADAEPVETPVEDEEKKCKEKNEEVEEPTEEPTEEPKEETPDYQAQIDALVAEIEALKTQIEEIVSKPVEEPVAEQFEKHTQTDNSGLNDRQKRAIAIAEAFKN